MENILSTLGTDEYTSTKLFCMYIRSGGPRMGKAEHMHQFLNFFYHHTCWEASAMLANPLDVFSLSVHWGFCVKYIHVFCVLFIYEVCAGTHGMHILIYTRSVPAALRPLRFLCHRVQSNRDHVHILWDLFSTWSDQRWSVENSKVRESCSAR